jgi:hypothetical protein
VLRRLLSPAGLVLLLILAACGGGGDASTTRPPHDLPTGEYLPRFNEFRAWADLAPVSDDPTLQAGGDLHCQWMVLNDVVAHAETPGTPGYTPEGSLAGQASNVAGQTPTPTTVEEPMRGWMTAPFHGVSMIDPRLTATAFSHYADNTRTYPMISYACALNVGSRRTAPPATTDVRWPGPGKVVDVLTYGGYEIPDPVIAYGLTPPTGLPVYLLLPVGTPYPPTTVTTTFGVSGGAALPHVVYHGGDYQNPDPDDRDLGRAVLAARRAIVLIPHAPLAPGTSYAVAITVDGVPHPWSFQTSAGATKPAVVPLTR